jgi:hypothetical protein
LICCFCIKNLTLGSIVLRNLKNRHLVVIAYFILPFDTQRVNFIGSIHIKKAIIKIIIFEAQKGFVGSANIINGGSPF